MYDNKMRIFDLGFGWQMERRVCGRRHAPDTPIVDRPEWAAAGGRQAGGGQRQRADSPRASSGILPLSPRERELYIQQAPVCRPKLIEMFKGTTAEAGV